MHESPSWKAFPQTSISNKDRRDLYRTLAIGFIIALNVYIFLTAQIISKRRTIVLNLIVLRRRISTNVFFVSFTKKKQICLS